LPSGEIAGSISLYLPQNGAMRGSVHLPSTSLVTMIV